MKSHFRKVHIVHCKKGTKLGVKVDLHCKLCDWLGKDKRTDARCLKRHHTDHRNHSIEELLDAGAEMWVLNDWKRRPQTDVIAFLIKNEFIIEKAKLNSNLQVEQLSDPDYVLSETESDSP